MARPVKKYKFRKQSKSLAEWAAEFGLPAVTVYARVNRLGWTMKDALMTPVRPKKQ